MASTDTETKSSYSKNIYLERKFAGTIKSILGNYFIRQDIQQDREQSTDFLIFTIQPFKVGVRLRRKNEYYECNKKEFTIRWALPSDNDTEIHKIRKNLVQYILYGFVSEDESKIIQYFIGDLRIFNAHYKKPRFVFPNKPRDSDLAVWEITDFPKDFVLHFYKGQ